MSVTPDTTQTTQSKRPLPRSIRMIAVAALIAVVTGVGLTLLMNSRADAENQRIESTYNVQILERIESEDVNRIITKDGDQTKECLTPTKDQMDSKTPLLCHVLEATPAR